MRKRIIFSISTLMLGILIYYLFAKGIVHNINFFTMIVRNFLPDSLWIISFFFLSINFIEKIFKKYIFWTALYSLILGIVFELFQKASIVKGTYDVLDIIVYMISIFTASIAEYFFIRGKNEKINN